MEVFERIPLFADADQLDRFACDGAHRQCRAAAAIAIGTRQDDAGDADTAIKGLGGVDGVLARQCVGNEQDFMRIDRGFDVANFVHQLFVDRHAAGGIVDDDVVAAELARILGAARNLQRCLPGDDWKCRDARLLAEHAQLLLRGGTARIERRHQHLLALAVRQAIGDLGGGRRFAGALQADHQDTDGRRGIEIDRRGVGAEHRNELVVDDLDDHLAGRHRAQHFGADGFGFDLLGEILDDLECDVGLEERPADFAHRLDDVAFRQRSAPRQLVKDARKPLCKTLKHSAVVLPDPRPCCCYVTLNAQMVSLRAKHKSTRERHALPDVNPPASRPLKMAMCRAAALVVRAVGMAGV